MSPRKDEVSLSAALERAILLAVLGGALVTALMVERNGLTVRGPSGGFPLRFWIWVASFYACGLVPLAASSWVIGSAGRRAIIPWIALGGSAAYLLAAALWRSGREMATILTLGAGSVPSPWLLAAVASLCLAGLVASVLLPLARRGLPRAITVGALAAIVLGLAPSSTASRVEPGAPSPEVAASRERFLLIGLDGASWTFIDPLVAEGKLPHIARLRDQGVSGPLGTLRPTRSPLIWTTMATGRAPEDHGIWRYRTTRLRGLYRDVSDLESPRGFALPLLYDVLERIGYRFTTTVTSQDRRVPALWTIASLAGIPVDVVNWWATWPAEPVIGRVVSERIHFWRLKAKGLPTPEEHLTHPPELFAQIQGDVLAPEDVTIEQARRFVDVTPAEFDRMKTASYRHHVLESELKYMISMFETNRAVALRLMRTPPGGDLPHNQMVLFRIIDLASHAALQYSPLVEDHLGSKPEDLEKYGRVVEEAYRAADAVVGELVEAFGEGNVILVSDHGFELVRSGGGDSYHHGRAPEGIFVASGPAFTSGRIESIGVVDVAPLLFFLSGLPVADDFAGRVPLEAFDPEFVDRHPVLRIPTYGSLETGNVDLAATDVDEEMLDRLRALGYIQ